MRKTNILYTLGAVTVGAISYLLINKDKGSTLNRKISKLKSKIIDSRNDNLPIEVAGIPEEDNLENSKMVSEGSQFGVNYYNKVKH